MKRVLIASAALLLILFALLALSFTAATLPITRSEQFTMPTARSPATMRLYAVPAGKLFSSAGLAYRGGSLSEERTFVAGGILVQHPQGNLLFDAGFSSHLAEDLLTSPWLARRLTRTESEATVAQQLTAAGIAPDSIQAIVPTHAHWDHVSGAQDFPGVSLLVPQTELDFINSGHEAAALARKVGIERYKTYAFEDGPYLGFERSHDMFDDGSVVIVPAPGHTPGSIIAFITLPGARRYALIGDLAWQREGIELPAERPWLPRSRLDLDPQAVRELLVRMHLLHRAQPDLIFVPAHDRRVWDTLPRLTAGSATTS